MTATEPPKPPIHRFRAYGCPYCGYRFWVVDDEPEPESRHYRMDSLREGEIGVCSYPTVLVSLWPSN